MVGVRLLAWTVVLASARLALATPAHYLVFESDATGVHLAFHRIVEMTAMPRSLDAPEAAALVARSPREAVRMTARLVDASGRVVHRTVAEMPREVRGEFHGAGAIDGHHIPAARGAFVVRVPVVDGTRLEIGGAPGSATLEVAARELTVEAGPLPPPVTSAAMSGNASNRVDLVVLGDGYTAAEQAKFNADAANAIAAFFGITPYAEYANFVNTYAVFTPSPQSGADHPPYNAACGQTHSPSCCADGDALSDPNAGTFVTTALDATFCSYNIHRLLVVDEPKAFAAAAAVPDWDVVLVVVNDDTYGGSGGILGVFSTNGSAIEIARHEYGHTFSLLADEYTTPYPGFPPCDDVGGGPPCEPNVTNQTVRAAIKWAPWIAGSTPVPTPDTNPYANVVGSFAGARYLSSGMYRPRHTCLMQALGVPFCEVCRQEYVLRLYEGGWGAPAGGIDTIEPGSEYPPPGDVAVHFPDFVGITVQLLQPTGGPPIGVSWSVDGVTAPGETQPRFSFTPTAQGTYQIVLTTHDPTPFVAPGVAGGALARTRTWSVTFDPSVSTSTSSSTSTTTSTSTTLPPLCADGAAITRVIAVERGNGPKAALTIRGRLEFPLGEPTRFAPFADGLQLALVDTGAAATIVSLTASSTAIPGGGPGSGCAPRDGWRLYTYRNVSGALDPPACTHGSAQGLRLVKLRDRRGRGRGIVFTARIAGAVPPLVGPLALTVVTSADPFAGVSGACAQTVVASCVRKARRIVCR
jgi:hypothetical protein